MLSYENFSTMGQQNSAPLSDNLPIANTISNGLHQPPAEHAHIWLITGPAGCGKSTVAEFLAKTMDLPYIEGDEYHPQSNIDKMSKGVPLTDADRWDWLTALREASVQRVNETGAQGVVLTCSALKRKYRDVIRVAPYYSHNVRVHFVYLHAPEKVLIERVSGRKGHYMGANMVHSQFTQLEAPSKDETDVITVDVSGTLEQVEQEALAKIREAVETELTKDS